MIETESNAKILIESCKAVIKLPMLRFESIADYYTCQPSHIGIKIQGNDDREVFEQILRVRKWTTNKKLESLSIYSNTRDLFTEESLGVVLRYSDWDRESDMNLVLNATDTEREKLLHSWPSLTSRSVYFETEDISAIKLIVKEIDSEISNGIKVEPSADVKERPYREIELMRAFNWGTIQAAWDKTKNNTMLERLIEDYCIRFREAISSHLREVFSIDHDYVFPLEVYKKIIDGDFK